MGGRGGISKNDIRFNTLQGMKDALARQGTFLMINDMYINDNTLPVISDMAEEVYAIQQEFGKLVDEIYIDRNTGAVASAIYKGGRTLLRLDYENLKEGKYFSNRAVKRSTENGWWPQLRNPNFKNSVVAHEMAHFIEYKFKYGRNTPYQNNQAYHKFMSHTTNSYIRYNRHGVSEYATSSKDPSEYFAEAFTIYRHGGSATNRGKNYTNHGTKYYRDFKKFMNEQNSFLRGGK